MIFKNVSRKFSINEGFTLIELLLVMGLMAVLATFATINLIRPQTTASIQSAVDTLASDLRQQQIKSMVGDSSGGSSASTYGIYVGSNSYTVFKGSSYSAGDANNFVFDLGTNTSISTTLPSSQVIFSRISGEVSSFVNGQNTITISSGGESKTITINRLGVVSIN